MKLFKPSAPNESKKNNHNQKTVNGSQQSVTKGYRAHLIGSNKQGQIMHNETNDQV